MCNSTVNIICQHSSPLEPLPTGETAVLSRLPGIRAVLFDVYGTMFISGSGEVGTADTDGRADAFDEAMQAVGIETTCSGADGTKRLHFHIKQSHKESLAKGIAHPEVDIIEVWSRVLDSLVEDETIRREAIIPDVERELAVQYEVRTNPVWSMPGLRDCLASLQNVGLLLGIISNAQFFTPCLFPALLKQEVNELGFHPRLQFYSYRYGQAKPGRFLYELARDELAALEVSPAETLFVGNDMLNDVAAAHAVGFRTALFAGDARSLRWRPGDERVANVTPDVVLTDLAQLTSIVGT